jgi:hypothetical protein
MFGRRQVDARRMPRGQAVMQTGTSKPAMIRPSKRRPSDTLTRRRASIELVKLIRKLRWLGMEEEAQNLENKLGRQHLR